MKKVVLVALLLMATAPVIASKPANGPTPVPICPDGTTNCWLR